MVIFPSFERYCEVHCPFVLDLTRIVLGVLIFYKGILFINDADSLNLIINNSKFGGMAIIVEHHVAFTLLAGGIMIALGFLTRIALIFQLPVFIGLLLNRNVDYGLYSVYSDFNFALVVTIVLLVFILIGPGPFSVDHYLGKANRKSLAD